MLLPALFLAFISVTAPNGAATHRPAEEPYLSDFYRKAVIETDSPDSLSPTRDNIPSLLLAPAKGATYKTKRMESDSPITLLTVKTNVIPWAATIMNVSPEVSFSRHISVTVPVWYCPWFVGEKRALRVLSFQPEVRWWFSSTGSGHFLGIHGSVAWYNLKYKTYRYQDTGRPLLGAGISYGYSLKISHNWGMEFSLGAGYVNTRYDRFYNVFNGRLHDTRTSSYIGIDHLSASFVYYIPLHKP